MAYNLLSCSGFGDAVASTSFAGIGSGDCIKARLALVLLFFIIAAVRRWGGEELGLDFNFALSLIGGLGTYILIITLFGSMKVALPLGIIGALVFGYGAGLIIGGGDSY